MLAPVGYITTFMHELHERLHASGFNACFPVRFLMHAGIRNNALGKPQKACFFSGPVTKDLPPPSPLELSTHIFLGNSFSELKKNIFFLSSRATKIEHFCGLPYASYCTFILFSP